MKPRIKRYLRGHSALAWECATWFLRGYGETPKAAYDSWMRKVRELSNDRRDPYKKAPDRLDLWDWW